jgi:hypothetical protein
MSFKTKLYVCERVQITEIAYDIEKLDNDLPHHLVNKYSCVLTNC